MKKSIIQTVVVALVSLGLGVAGGLLGFDLKGGVCSGSNADAVKSE